MSEQPSEEDYAQGLRKQQMVMEFDMATWRVCSRHAYRGRVADVSRSARHRSLQHHGADDPPACEVDDADRRQVVRIAMHPPVCHIVLLLIFLCAYPYVVHYSWYCISCLQHGIYRNYLKNLLVKVRAPRSH